MVQPGVVRPGARTLPAGGTLFEVWRRRPGGAAPAGRVGVTTRSRHGPGRGFRRPALRRPWLPARTARRTRASAPLLPHGGSLQAVPPAHSEPYVAWLSASGDAAASPAARELMPSSSPAVTEPSP